MAMFFFKCILLILPVNQVEDTRFWELRRHQECNLWPISNPKDL